MTRGGKRPGAGRPFLKNPRDKRVQMSVSVDPKTKIMADSMREDGIKVGKIVDEAVKEVCKLWIQGADLSNLK